MPEHVLIVHPETLEDGTHEYMVLHFGCGEYWTTEKGRNGPFRFLRGYDCGVDWEIQHVGLAEALGHVPVFTLVPFGIEWPPWLVPGHYAITYHCNRGMEPDNFSSWLEAELLPNIRCASCGHHRAIHDINQCLDDLACSCDGFRPRDPMLS